MSEPLSKIPRDGIRIPLPASFAAPRFLPRLGLAHSNAFPGLVLARESVITRVSWLRERPCANLGQTAYFAANPRKVR
jgi:hypothetical protein